MPSDSRTTEGQRRVLCQNVADELCEMITRLPARPGLPPEFIDDRPRDPATGDLRDDSSVVVRHALTIMRLRTLLNAWLLSGAMNGADLDKLRADTEEALNV